MDKEFFNKTRILDGGMGQELLHRGLKPKGTLWSAQALIDKDCSNGHRCSFRFHKCWS